MTIDVPPPPANRPPTDWIRMLGWIWFAHGLLLVLGAPSLVAAHGFSASSGLWNEIWEQAGYPNAADPIARALQWASDRAWFIGALGLISSLLGITALISRTYARWPLHTLAVIHIVILPWATWELHQSLALSGAPALIFVVQECIAVASSCICLVLAVIVVERSRPGRDSPR